MRLRALPACALALAGALAGALLLPASAAAQGYRGRATTSVSFVQLRELAVDSVPAAGVAGAGARRTLADGTRATCGAAYCWFYRSGEERSVAPVIQDLELSLWPGVPGWRAFAQLRARQPLGDEDLWPRLDKRLEVLSAYVEFSRPRLRARGGRLWRTGGLGFYNFDGADLLLRLPAHVEVEGFAGLSLLRGLDERPTGALLAAIEPFPPDEDAYLLGAQALWRPIPGASGSVTYQRELRTDRAGLYSERVAAAVRVLAEGTVVDLDFEHDLATNTTNEARVRVLLPVGTRATASAEFRSHRPYFDLWTIWGSFAPVSFGELRLSGSWSDGAGNAGVQVGAAYRRYDDTDAGTTFTPVADDGWRVDADGHIEPADGWLLTGSYRIETGFGAARSGLDVAARRALGEHTSLGLSAGAFQRVAEFEVGVGTVFALGADAGFPIGDASVRAGAAMYRHAWSDRPAFVNWSQFRAHAFVEIPIGRDPGSPRERTSAWGEGAGMARGAMR